MPLSTRPTNATLRSSCRGAWPITAYISVPSERPFYVWKVADLKTGKSRKLDNFLATQEESVSYHYFDQLALSHTIWSPDSSSFVYAGVRLLVEPDQVVV